MLHADKRERAWYLIALDQPTTVQSMGRVQIARRQCLHRSMQGTAYSCFFLLRKLVR